MSNGKILIVGGYGAVGRVISITLGNLFPGEVIVAGRNIQKAKELSSELDQKVIPLELDITTTSNDEELLKDVNLIIMCIDQENTHFFRRCIKREIHYIDITANYDFFSKIEALNDETRNLNSTVILSVGLALGITNLFAKQCKAMIQDIRYVDIFIMLGIGEKHGDAAFRWVFKDLNDQFFIKEDGEKKQIRSFEDGKQAMFPGNLGRRTTYRSNFSDQHVIPNTLKIDSVSTRVCFDSSVMTWLYSLLKKSGLSRLLKLMVVQNFIIKLLQLFHFGSDQFVLKVEAGNNRKQGTLYECSIRGNGVGVNTGLIAAKVAENIYMSSFPSGVFHIEELFNPLEFIDSISNNDLRFEKKLLKGG